MNRKELICKLLKGIETGDPDSVAVVDEDRYIQHNPQTHEGSEGLAALFERLSKTDPRVNIIRVFEDGDFVFAHTEYDFSERNIGFEVFRFEGDKAVEHWDNIQKRHESNGSGHSMVDGETELQEHDKTESNRDIVQRFVDEVLIGRNGELLYEIVKWNAYTEHSPRGEDDLSGWMKIVSPETIECSDSIVYERCHRILSEGNFVLSVCEGSLDGVPTAFYDLYRLEHDYIMEHWETTEAIPPVGEWNNENGKF